MSIKIKDIQFDKEDGKHQKKKKNDFDFLNKEISFSKTKLSDKQKQDFYSGLETLLRSGIDLHSALQIIGDEDKKKIELKTYDSLYQSLVAGQNLSDAMKDSQQFTSHECYSVSIGEETGRLKEILQDLNLFFVNKIKQKRQLISTFTYPAIVISTAILVVTFMMNFIVPMFVDIFKRFNGELPGLTKWVMETSEAFQQNFWWGVLFIAFFVLFIYSSKQKVWFKKYTSSLLLKIPLVGTLLTKAYLARFCQTMALLMKAKIPLLRAINLMKKMITFYPLEQALLHFESEILKGKMLHEVMDEFDFFDKKIKSLTKVGEEINKLDEIYSNLNEQYSDELQHQVGILNGLLEPILIIFVGILVAVILIAMYLPMFQMSNTFG